MKKILILFAIIVSSCSPNVNETVTDIANLGDYEAISAVSNIAFDGNFDAVYSTDFLEEFKKYGPRLTPSIRVARNENINLVYLLSNFAIMTRFPPEFQSDSTNVNLNGFTAEVYHNNGLVYSSLGAIDREGNRTNTNIMSCTFIDKDTIALKINHEQIYDIQTKQWKTIIVDMVFKRKVI